MDLHNLARNIFFSNHIDACTLFGFKPINKIPNDFEMGILSDDFKKIDNDGILYILNEVMRLAHEYNLEGDAKSMTIYLCLKNISKMIINTFSEPHFLAQHLQQNIGIEFSDV